MIGRRTFMTRGAAGAALASGLAAPAGRALGRQGDLVFPTGAFQIRRARIATPAGDVMVTYRFWRALPYVADPVDARHQSLNVCVPVEINNVAIDAGAAPILLATAMGGYAPISVADADGVSAGRMALNARLGLAAGLVVVEPGLRGRTLVDRNGVHYGVAPAAIVDLKAAVRYLRANAGRIPGNVERIVSAGSSAGGAVSALLGASGDSPLYARHLAELGAADASDAIFAAGAWCPITDLENADGAYEWCWGANPLEDGRRVDPALSAELAAGFAAYQAGLGLPAPDGSGPLTADRYGRWLVEALLRPAATARLAAMSEIERAAYLFRNPTIGWGDGGAAFDWPGFVAHIGTRLKPAPAFDALDLSSIENALFGRGTTKARHFTPFSLRRATGDGAARLDPDLAETLRLMNPMPFLAEAHPGRARHWWIRNGAADTHTSHSVAGNLAAMAARNGDRVTYRIYWDAGHVANEDAGAFIDWIRALPG